MVSLLMYNLCIFFGGMMFERLLRVLNEYLKEYFLYKRYHSNHYDPE